MFGQDQRSWPHVLETESGLYGRLNQLNLGARPSSKGPDWMGVYPLVARVMRSLGGYDLADLAPKQLTQAWFRG